MIVVKLTNGLGNNFFQFIAAKQMAIAHSQELALYCQEGYYGIEIMEALGIKVLTKNPLSGGRAVNVNDDNYSYWLAAAERPPNLMLNGYFENYKYYVDSLAEIGGWFPSVDKRPSEDMVLHLRAGDRLLYKSTFSHRTRVETYLEGLSQFEFENLHIVTDMPRWGHYTAEEIEEMNVHCPVPQEVRVDSQSSADYFNSFVDGLAYHNPIVTRRSIFEDFNFMRSFDKIMIQHSTLAWWAAVLSDASSVGVYGPWRPWKGKSNKNLSNIGLEGWFQWGK